MVGTKIEPILSTCKPLARSRFILSGGAIRVLNMGRLWCTLNSSRPFDHIFLNERYFDVISNFPSTMHVIEPLYSQIHHVIIFRSVENRRKAYIIEKHSQFFYVSQLVFPVQQHPKTFSNQFCIVSYFLFGAHFVDFPNKNLLFWGPEKTFGLKSGNNRKYKEFFFHIPFKSNDFKNFPIFSDISERNTGFLTPSTSGRLSGGDNVFSFGGPWL